MNFLTSVPEGIKSDLFRPEVFIYRARILQCVAGLAEKIPAWFASAVTRYLAPEIIRIVDERVTRSESSLKELMNARFKAVDDRFKALEETMNARFATLDAKIDGFEKRLDLVQRVALLEAKVREMETKR
jgi:hypothetical protein